MGIFSFVSLEIFYSQCKEGSHNQVSQLLAFLRKGDDDKILDDLIGSLRDSEQDHVAEVIVDAREASYTSGSS